MPHYRLITCLLSISTSISAIDYRLTKIICQKKGQLLSDLPQIRGIPSNLNTSFKLNKKQFQLRISVESVAPT